jgi:putative sterol carrier protein
MSKSTTAAREKAPGMTEFLQALEQRGHEPALDRTSGTVRFDLQRNGGAEHWLLEIRRGTFALSRAAGPADCVVRGTAEVMDDLAGGRTNALAAMLRGELSITGDRRLLVRVQRVFPSPTGRRATSSSRVVGRRRG